jgi:hypothetical protein
MTTERRFCAAILSACLPATAACVTYRGPHGMEAAIEEQLGVNLDREFGLKLGWTATKIAGAFVGNDDDEDALVIRELTGIGVAVFKIPERGSRPAAIDPARLRVGRFETVLNVRDQDGQVLVLTKAHKGSIREMIFLANDGDEVVVGRLKGDLDALLDRVIRGADEDGVRGARHAVPVAAR